MNFFGFFRIPIFELFKTKSEIFITTKAFQKMRKSKTDFSDFLSKSLFLRFLKNIFLKKMELFRVQSEVGQDRMVQIQTTENNNLHRQVSWPGKLSGF